MLTMMSPFVTALRQGRARLLLRWSWRLLLFVLGLQTLLAASIFSSAPTAHAITCFNDYPAGSKYIHFESGFDYDSGGQRVHYIELFNGQNDHVWSFTLPFRIYNGGGSLIAVFGANPGAAIPYSGMRNPALAPAGYADVTRLYSWEGLAFGGAYTFQVEDLDWFCEICNSFLHPTSNNIRCQ